MGSGCFKPERPSQNIRLAQAMDSYEDDFEAYEEDFEEEEEEEEEEEASPPPTKCAEQQTGKQQRSPLAPVAPVAQEQQATSCRPPPAVACAPRSRGGALEQATSAPWSLITLKDLELGEELATGSFSKVVAGDPLTTQHHPPASTSTASTSPASSTTALHERRHCTVLAGSPRPRPAAPRDV